MSTPKSMEAYGLDLCLYLSSISTNSLKRFLKREAVPEVCLEIIDFIPEYLAYVGLEQVESWSDFHKIHGLLKPATALHKEIELACANLNSLPARAVSASLLQTFIDFHYADKIAETALEVASGNTKGLQGITKLIEQHSTDSVILNRERAEESSSDVSDAIDSIKRTGLSWPIESLNKIIGPFDAQFFIVAARPDGGKTTFLAQTAAHVARHHSKGEKRILWFNNEEAIKTIKQRVVSSITGMSKEDVDADPVEAKARYAKWHGHDIEYIDDALSITQVERIINKHNPCLIIIDQLYKIKGTFHGKEEMEAERFRQLCSWARGIAKHVAPVIVTNQLDGSAENVKYPSMEHLYGSKTGAQGEADCIIMIGRSAETPDKRYIHTPKNKLTGRVMGTEVLLNRDYARFEDE